MCLKAMLPKVSIMSMFGAAISREFSAKTPITKCFYSYSPAIFPWSRSKTQLEYRILTIQIEWNYWLFALCLIMSISCYTNIVNTI